MGKPAGVSRKVSKGCRGKRGEGVKSERQQCRRVSHYCPSYANDLL